MHGYSVIADIVGFTDASAETQRTWAAQFLRRLRLATEDVEGFGAFTIIPTGDGAILSVCDESEPSPETAGTPLDLARALLRANAAGDFRLRVGINYSGAEALVDVPPFKGDDASQIQVGNGLTFAERIIHFAEPNEIVLTGQYRDLVREHLPERRREFRAHREVFVKHTRKLELFSYKPTPDETYIYGAPEDEKDYKRYAYFPPLQPETVNRFRELRLRKDLGNLCTYAYETIAAVNTKRTFISWGDIYKVLENVPTADGDKALVLSRADRGAGFWSTKEAREYLKYLKRPDTPELKPYRIFLHDPRMKRQPLVSADVLSDLRDLHDDGTLRQLDVAHARGNLLFKYIFGVTILPRLNCAIAPIPVAASYDEYLQIIRYGKAHDAFARFLDADFAHSPFRALIIAKEDSVDKLTKAFDELRGRPTEPLT